MIADSRFWRLAHLAPASIEELNARAALQRRVDRKYVVSGPALDALIAAVPADMSVLEIEGTRSFAYRTLYFDSPDLLTYRAHVQRRRRRFKCRSRLYVNSNLHMLEIKLKGRRGETVKERLALPLEAHGVWSAAASRFLREQLLRHYGSSLVERLEPALAMSYSRLTLAPLAGGERVTVDVDLRYELADGWSFVLAPDTAIVESKSASGNATIDRLLRNLGVRPVSCSKYCVGIALTRPEEASGNDFLRLARRHFRPGSVPTHTSNALATAL